MKKNILFIIFVFIFVSAPMAVYAFPTPSLAAKEYIKRGKDYYKDRDFDRAVEEFNKALMADPTCQEAKHYLKLMGYGDDDNSQALAGEGKREQGASPTTKIASTSPQQHVQDWDEADLLESSEDRQAIEALREQFDLEKQIAIQKFRANAAKEQQSALEELRTEESPSQTQESSLVSPTKDKKVVVNKNKSKKEKQGKAKPKSKAKSIPAEALSPAKSDIKSTSLENESLESKTEEVTKLSEATKTSKEKSNTPSKSLSKKEAKLAAKQAKIEAKKAKIVAQKAAKEEAKAAAKEKARQKAEEKAALKRQGKKAKSAHVSEPASVKLTSKDLTAAVTLEKPDSESVSAPEEEVTLSGDAQGEKLTPPSSEKEKKYQKAKQEADLAKKEKELIEKMQMDNAIKERRMRKKMEEDYEAKEKQLLAQFKEDESLLSNAQEGKGKSSSSVSSMSTAKIAEIEEQNANLRKQLADVIAMSQKDQELIQKLQNQPAVKSSDMTPIPVTPQPEIQAQVEELKDRQAELKNESEKIKTLKEKIAALEDELHSKKFDFTSKQLDYEKKLEELQADLGNAQYAKAKSEDDLKDQLQTLKNALEKKVAELNSAQEQLLFMEQKLKKRENQYTVKTSQYEDLKKTLADLENRLSGLQGKMGDGEESGKGSEFTVANLPKPSTAKEEEYAKWIQRHDKLVTKLKQKLLWAREQIDYLGSYDIKLNDQKMAALKEELAKAKQQLSAQQSMPGTSSENQELLEQRLKDTQERLNMVEKILKEKDQQIQDLENQLNGALSAIQ